MARGTISMPPMDAPAAFNPMTVARRRLNHRASMALILFMDTPPPATGTLFADMTDTTYWATKWAEQAYLDGLLPACSDGPRMFCPFVMLDRAWGAYLIVQAKDLLLP